MSLAPFATFEACLALDGRRSAERRAVFVGIFDVKQDALSISSFSVAKTRLVGPSVQSYDEVHPDQRDVPH